VLREIVSWPISMARAAIDLPKQLEVMRRQADQALEQAERMNQLLTRVVKLTEPLERAQRSGEYVGEALKRAIFGEEAAAIEAEVVAAQEADQVEEPPDSLREQ
jgi:tRNA(Leu) C34 or U34 (ribose-2'-O)-methylase TrmL